MKHQKGNTVVELVLYMGLLSIFLVALFNLFIAIITTQTRSNAVSLVQTTGNYLLSKLVYDINQADSIVIPVSVGSSSITMSLKTGTVTSVYSIDNGRLVLNDGTNSYNLNDVDTSISNFLVRRLGTNGGVNSLQLNFTITSLVVDPSGSKSNDFTTTISKR